VSACDWRVLIFFNGWHVSINCKRVVSNRYNITFFKKKKKSRLVGTVHNGPGAPSRSISLQPNWSEAESPAGPG